MPLPPKINHRCNRHDQLTSDEAVADEIPVGEINASPDRILDVSVRRDSRHLPVESVVSRVLSSSSPSRKRHLVWLHVYDLDAITGRLNELLLKSVNLGAFHCGVEVLGYEWFASYGLTSNSGVIRHSPKGHSVHIYRESVCMGESPLSADEIEAALCDAMDNWPQNSYHPISRNCLAFAEELVAALRVPEPFPVWIRGASDAAKSKVVFPVADAAWEWIKWYNARPAAEMSPMSDGASDAGRSSTSSLITPWGSEHGGEAPVVICRDSGSPGSSRIRPLPKDMTERTVPPNLITL